MLPDRRENPNATFTFREAEQIFEQEKPAFLKVRSNSEAEKAKREFIYHSIAVKLADEKGILVGDPEAPAERPVITKTLRQWHGLWADALGDLLDKK